MVAALGALWLLAFWPVARAGYPGIGDGLNHFYRLVEFEHLLRQGDWFPRWAADLGYGYGYPLFNFYPPLTYYLGALFHGLGLDEAGSLLAVYGLGWALALGGAYRLARERAGRAGALVAAAAYGLAPYLYFNALARGAVPETLALGLLPWALWAFYRLGARPGRSAIALAGGLTAALILTHLLTALLALPLAALFWLMAAGTLRPRRLAQGAAAGLAGFGLAAYFLLPALLETGAVRLSQLTQPGDLDFHNNFIPLSTLLAWPQTFDPRLVFQAVAPSLSLAALALAAASWIPRAWGSRIWGGLAVGAWKRRQRAGGLDTWDAGLWLGLLALGGLALPLGRLVWEAAPGMGLIQFPWRLVGPASLLLALLAGRGIDRLAALAPRPAWWLAPAAIAGLFFFSLTWTFSAGAAAPTTATVRDLAGYERDSGQLGTTSAGEFLPASVEQLPDPHGLDAAYAASDVIERLAAPLPGVTVEAQSATTRSAEAVVSAEAASTLTFDFFDFPGWRAAVDGQPAAITPSTPNGLINVAVPAGRHTVAVGFGSTVPRSLGGGMSLGTLAGLGVLGWLSMRRRRAAQAGGQQAQGGDGAAPRLYGRQAWLLALSALALLLVRGLAIDGHDTLFSQSRFDGERVAGVGRSLDINFNDELVLVGMDAPSQPLAADGEMAMTLYWRAQNAPAGDYATTVQVLDGDGNIWGQADSQNPGRLPATRWRPGQYARDEHRLRLLAGTPPGTYRLAVGVYAPGGAGLSVLDAAGGPLGQMADVGALTVTRGEWDAAQLAAVVPADLPLGPVAGWASRPARSSPQAGDELRLAWFWRGEGGAPPDLSLHLALRAADGAVIQTWDGPLARPDYPAADWTDGEIVRGVVTLLIPAAAPAGPAQLEFSLRSAAGGADPGGADPAGTVQAAALEIRTPQRSFEVPPLAHPLDVEWGGQVRLLGYDAERTNGRVTLVWQALLPMNTRYEVFVHALDAGGQIIAQVDAVPVGGTRPTMGWLPGEVIVDTYTLPLQNAAALEAGMFDYLNGQRLGIVRIEFP